MRCCEKAAGESSDQDALDFIERNLIIPPVVEAGRAGALMVRHLLRDFKLAAVPQVFCDAGRAEGVAPDLRLDAGGASVALRPRGLPSTCLLTRAIPNHTIISGSLPVTKDCSARSRLSES